MHLRAIACKNVQKIFYYVSRFGAAFACNHATNAVILAVSQIAYQTYWKPTHLAERVEEAP